MLFWDIFGDRVLLDCRSLVVSWFFVDCLEVGWLVVDCLEVDWLVIDCWLFMMADWLLWLIFVAYILWYM